MGKASRGKRDCPENKRESINVGENFAISFLIIALTGILIYSKTLSFPFHFDDGFNIVENYKLRDLSNFWPPSETRYIGLLSFALNYHFGELNVFGYHLVNLGIHIINGFLIWWLIVLTFQTPRMEGADAIFQQKKFIALLSALIFISHPVQTQAVTYIVQRFTSLATLFCLLSLVTYIKARLSIRISSLNPLRKQRDANIKAWMYYGTSILCTLLAMKTKEISFTLPFMIALYEFTFFKSPDPGFRTPNLKRSYMLIPFLLTLLMIPLSLTGIDKNLGDIIGEVKEVTQETERISRDAYLLTQFRVIVTYIRLLFLPISQNLDYDYPIYPTFTLPVFLSLLFLFPILSFAFYSVHKSRVGDCRLRLIAFGIFWFFITLSVESSLIPIRDVINEHRLYLPSVGIIISFSLAVFWALNDVKKRISISMIDYLVILAIVLPLGIATYNRNLVWGDDVTLWKDVVRKSPNKARGHYNLGLAYHHQGQLDEAIKEYKVALQLKPDYLGAHNNLGLTYYNQGRLEDAMKEYRTALQLKPDFPDAHLNLGLVYYSQGQLNEAIREYRIALQLAPDHPGVHNNLGLAYHDQGRLEEAIQEYKIALQLQPDYPEAYNHLGLAYSSQGRLEKAIQEYISAIRLKPDFSEAHNNLGLAYHQQGRLKEAVQEYLTAIKLKSGFPVVHYRLGLAYHQQGRLEEAIQEYMTAIRLEPDFPEAHNNLGLAYDRQGRLEEAIQEYMTAIRLKPDFPEAHYNLGKAYTTARAYDEARIQFEIVLKLRPDFSAAQEALKYLDMKSHEMRER